MAETAKQSADRRNIRSHRRAVVGQRLTTTDRSVAQPAARVIRTSPAIAPTLTGDEGVNGETQQQKDFLPPVVLDAIVEKRKPRKQRSKQATVHNSKKNGSVAVPSVHDIPLGALVPNGGGGSVHGRATHSRKEEGAKTPVATNDDDISKASDRLLQGMSPAEIQDALQELHTSLDAKKIAFLQQRRKKKQQNASTTAKTGPATGSRAPTTTVSAETIANQLSAIKTYEDLDAAVAASKERNEIASSTIPSALPDAVANSSNPFDVACHLLRSSSSPQVQWAARTVAKELEYLQQQQQQQPTDPERCWDPPTSSSSPSFLLPVALRCLIDATTNTTPPTLEYAWKALDSLVHLMLQLTTERIHHRRILQHDGLCDIAVVTDSSQSALSSNNNNNNNSSPLPTLVDDVPTALEGAVYCTTNSNGSGSAQADARAFWKDPLWTLLSRMRILPRCAQTLQLLQRRQRQQQQQLSSPVGSIMMMMMMSESIARILTRVAERSVGAATAIAQHTTLLPDACSLLFTSNDAKTAATGWSLVTTLLQQSRYTAAILAPRIIPHILQQCSAAATHTESTSAALVAWRMLFRYRLILTVDEENVDTTKDERQDTTKEEALLDSRVLLTFAAPHLADTTTSGTAADWYSVLAATPGDEWAFSSAQLNQALQQWRTVMGRLQDVESDNSNGDLWRLLAAVLQYVQAFLRFRRNRIHSSVTSEASTGVQERTAQLDAITELLQLTIDSPVVQQRVRSLFPFVSVVDTGFATAACPVNTFMDTRAESSACTAISHLLGILQDRSMAQSGTLRTSAVELFSSAIQQHHCPSPKPLQQSSTPEQLFWRNQLASSVLLYLWSAPAIDSIHDVHRLREFSLVLVSKLQNGDESTLSRLLEPGRLISTQTTISDVLQHHLTGSSSHAASQLQHSRKLRYETGTESELVSCLLSCRSERVTHKEPYESLLPLGEYWPWRMLAGDFRTSDTANDAELNSTARTILESALTLIRELEDNFHLYARNLDAGPKLYYLANLCLIRPAGSVFGLESNCALVESLLSRYVPCFSGTSQTKFAEACREHFALAESGVNKLPASPKYSDEEEKINAVVQQSLPSQLERSLELFINDLLQAHENGGVNSDIFNKFLRLFLCHKIPIKARCQILQHFRNSIHLLSIPEEVPKERHVWYSNIVAGGLPSIDGSPKDSPEFLDCMASLYPSTAGIMLRDDDHFVFSLARMVFARSLAIAKQTQSGIPVTCARVLKLNPTLQTAAVCDFLTLLETNQRLEDLLSLVSHSRDQPSHPSLPKTLDSVSLTDLLQDVNTRCSS